MKLSIEVQADASPQIKLQLMKIVDGLPHGVIADFDLQQRTTVPFRTGRGMAIDSGIEPIDDGQASFWFISTPA